MLTLDPSEKNCSGGIQKKVRIVQVLDPFGSVSHRAPAPITYISENPRIHGRRRPELAELEAELGAAATGAAE